jgi:hypothetical protein
MRLNLLTLKVLPTLAKSRTEQEDPSCKTAKTATDDPIRANVRSESVLPKSDVAKRDIAEPS